MVDEIDDAVDESEQQEPDLAPIYRQAFASLSRSLSLAADEAMRLKVFENAVDEAIRLWKGIERSDAFDALNEIAEARGFDPDWVQSVFARAAEAEPEPKANGNGQYGPDVQEPPPDAEPDDRPEPKPQAPPLTPLAFFSVEVFEGRALRERQWLVNNRIPMRNVTLLGGDGATGKTTIALQLFIGVTKTGEWLKGNVSDGSVLFLTAEEEEDEVHRRLDAIREAREISYADIARLQIYCMPGQNAVLAQPNKQGQLVPTELFQRLELTVRAQRPTLICLESSADVFGGNEIDRVQVRQFISMLRSWSLIDGAAVMLLSHPSLSGLGSGSGTSGSTGWNNSVRSRLYFKIKKEKDKDADEFTRNDYRILEVMKSNYGPAGESVECVWRNGLFIPVDQADADPVVKANKAMNADAAFLRCLDIRNNREQWVNQQESSPTRYAPKIFANMAEGGGFKIKALAEAMSRLLDKGALTTIKAPNTPPSDKLRILVRKQMGLV
jgi:RecA-family ATPase